MMSLKNILLAACFSLLLSGCSMMPASGPYSAHMKHSGKVGVQIASVEVDNQRLQYAVADINPNLLKYISKQAQKFKGKFKWPEREPAEQITVNVGDTIQISIFESKSGGLFVPEGSSVRPGNFVSLPQQTIDSTGIITVPYAGKVTVAGKTTKEISNVIEERLADKAIEPQVVVSFGDRSGAEVSVIGDVNNARRLSLGFNQYKVLDAIASAGGPTSPGYETKVSLQRNDLEYTIPFDQLVVDPDKNIYSKINDILYLYREPETFTAYGAVQRQGTIDFGKRNLLLSEALGLTSGLRDAQADPAEIYIYRQRKYPYFKDVKKTVMKKTKPAPASKPKKKVKSILGAEGDVTPSFKTYSKIGRGQDVKTVSKTLAKTKPEDMVEDLVETTVVETEVTDISVIFKLDMRKPSSFFLAQNFMMEDRDIIYVANAKSVEFLKFLGILGTTSSTTISTDNVFPL